MAILISAHNLSKSFGARPLFDDLSFVVESGERIGLIGPNGAGKSTLLRILADEIGPDEGNLSRQRGLRIGYLQQDPALEPEKSIRDTVLSGTEDPHDGEAQAKVEELMAKLSLNSGKVTPETIVGTLSGGWRKRVALARALAGVPDLLLLDEPTNHLDIESILWLEEMLARSSFALLTITHDRLFLQRVSNRILELDRRNEGGLLSVRGDYATYLERKEQAMAAQEQKETTLRNTLRRETEWLRRGAKARTTKQQARIQRAGELKDEVNELGVRNQTRNVKLDFQASDRNPKRLIEAKAIAKDFEGKRVFNGVDLWVGPGSRIGLLGPNGCGKSTLIRVLLGQDEPTQGSVFRSEHLRVAYFDQTREILDPEVTVAKTLAPHGDMVIYRGRPTHVKGYLDRFLFKSEQRDMKVGKLSGGEQARLLIARLMLSEANLLVLDEPTNDLDMATLDVLQDCLSDFNGAVLLVTHDRYFLDQVATEIHAFHQGKLTVFAGLSQWESWHEALDAPAKAKPAIPSSSGAAQRRKLSYKEQREFDSMEERIHQAEAALEKATAEASSPEVASNAARLTELYQMIHDAQAEIDRLYARWAELEALKPG